MGTPYFPGADGAGCETNFGGAEGYPSHGLVELTFGAVEGAGGHILLGSI